MLAPKPVVVAADTAPAAAAHLGPQRRPALQKLMSTSGRVSSTSSRGAHHTPPRLLVKLETKERKAIYAMYDEYHQIAHDE